MPRNVRNFWLEGRIDGRASEITGGPVSAGGGFTLTVYQRDGGRVTTAARITGWATPDGTLRLDVEPLGHEFKAIDGLLQRIDENGSTMFPNGIRVETKR